MRFSLSVALIALTLALSSLAPRVQADAFADLAQFQFGQSREPLALIEEQIRKAAPADYGAIETRFITLLQAPNTTVDARRFICRWLAVVGSARCVPEVAALLVDAELSHPARMALEVLPQSEAAAALRAALPVVQGKQLVGVIASLGTRRDPLAVKALAGYVSNADALVAETAVMALGQIGTEEAASVLESAQVAPGLVRPLAQARLTAAHHLAQAGKSKPAVAIFRSLQAPSLPAALRGGAVQGLIGALPPADAARFMLDQLQGDDAFLRSATIAAFAALKNPALKNRVAAALPSLKPAGQSILLGVLADQPDVTARNEILAVLKTANDVPLRVAALECLALHGEAAEVPALVSLANDPSAPVAEAARKTLSRLGKPGVNEALIRLIAAAAAGERGVVLSTLANRRAVSALPTLVKLLSGSDAALAAEAAKALGSFGRTDNLRDVILALTTTEDATVRTAAAEAAKAICRRAPDKAAAAEPLLAAWGQTTATAGRVALLDTLVLTSGDPALYTVVGSLTDENADVRSAAVRALVAWPEATASLHLLKLARTNTNPDQAVVALRDGCLRLAEREELPLAERVRILRGVVQVAARAEEKNRALALLSELPSMAALEIVTTCASDPALQTGVVNAAAKLARELGAVFHRQTLAALATIKEQIATDALRQQLDTAIQAAENAGQSPEGFLLAWLLSGPYTQADRDAGALFDLEFAPEQTGAAADWRPVAGAKSGMIELDKTLRGDNRVAYLKTVITSDQAQAAVLELGSDDGVKVWLNGRVVLAANATRPCVPGQDKVNIALKSGANPLLLKITQGGGEWSVCCRLCGADGKPLSNVSVGPNPE